MTRILIRTTLRKRLNHFCLRRDLRRLLSLLRLTNVELSLLLVGDRKMRSLNRSFRGIDRTTDVLSFPQLEWNIHGLRNKKGILSFRSNSKRQVMLGDIVINPCKIKRQARLHKVPLKRELRLILIHGVLHLLGYDHERDEKSRAEMERLQERLLDALEKLDHKC